MAIKPWREEMIRRFLQKLCESFGKPKQPIDPRPLRFLWNNKNYIGMVRLIKDSLNLQNLNVTLGKVRSGGPKDASAWVELPKLVPLYGSKEFREMSVTVFVRNNRLRDDPFEVIIKTIAHECSHIILRSTAHPLQESEEATDLTAMILGYHEFYLQGFEEIDRTINSPLKQRGETLMEYMKRMGKAMVGLRYEIETYLTTSEIRFANEWIRARL